MNKTFRSENGEKKKMIHEKNVNLWCTECTFKWILRLTYDVTSFVRMPSRWRMHIDIYLCYHKQEVIMKWAIHF